MPIQFTPSFFAVFRPSLLLLFAGILLCARSIDAQTCTIPTNGGVEWQGTVKFTRNAQGTYNTNTTPPPDPGSITSIVESVTAGVSYSVSQYGYGGNWGGTGSESINTLGDGGTSVAGTAEGYNSYNNPQSSGNGPFSDFNITFTSNCVYAISVGSGVVVNGAGKEVGSLGGAASQAQPGFSFGPLVGSQTYVESSISDANETYTSTLQISWNLQLLGSGTSPQLAIVTSQLPQGIVGAAYPTTTLSATGGAPPYSWTVGGLPSGLLVSASTGVISGTPKVPLTSSPVTITVTDSSGATAEKSLNLTISQPRYSIVINGADGTSGPPFTVFPSIVACGKTGAIANSISLKAAFVDPSTNNEVPGGALNISVAEKQFSGGHPHTGRPLGVLASPSGQSPLTSLYTVGEASGEIDITASGTAPDGSLVAPVNTAVSVQAAGSPFSPLSGPTFNIQSHPQGVYGTSEMQNAVQRMADLYIFYAHQLKILSPHPILSEAASLPLGGIFDIDLDWEQPHCGHRDGRTIDLSLSNTTPKERVALSLAAHAAGLAFYYLPESPDSKTANHWHATLTH